MTNKFHQKICIAAVVTTYLYSSNIYSNETVDLSIDPELLAQLNSEPLPDSVTSVVASVVTREEIKQFGYRSISEALAHVTGFHVGLGDRGGPIYSIRGFTSDQAVLFLVNNEPYSSSLWGSHETAIGLIPIDMVERVEVIRGPGSSKYGIGAMTGVVNIITRDDPATRAVSLTVGPYDSRRITATSGFEISDRLINIGIDMVETEGHETTVQSDYQTDLDDQFDISPGASHAPSTVNFDFNAIGLNLDYINGEHKVSARLGISNDVGIGVGFINIVDEEGSWDANTLNTTYRFPLVSNKALEISGTTFLQNRQYRLRNINFFPDGAFNSFPDGVELNLSHTERYYGAGLTGTIYKIPKHNISFELRTSLLNLSVDQYEANYNIGEIGITPVVEGTNTSREGESFKRNTSSLQLTDVWALTSNIQATLGAGYEYISNEPEQITPRFAMTWAVRSDTTLKFLYGKGVRTPALVETVDVGIPVLSRNLTLNPERFESYDIVVEHNPTQNVSVKANIFLHRTKDQIVYTFQGVNGFKPENVGIQNGEGVELEVLYNRSPKFQMRAYGHYQENYGGYLPGSPNEEIGYSPHYKAGVQLRGTNKQYSYGVSYMYTGDRDRPALDEKPKAQKYHLVDIGLSYKTKDNFILKTKIENVLDSDILEANFSASSNYDLQLPGRSLYLGVEKVFR